MNATRTLVIGYGNASRRDDGVALLIVNGLRRRLGLGLLSPDDDGSTDLGRPLDTLFLQQLTPELAETLAHYERVVFVDAHTGAHAEAIRRVALSPEMDRALVSHHVKPGMLLALAHHLYGATTAGELVSVRGYDFDFGTEISPATAQAAEQVIGMLWQEAARGPTSNSTQRGRQTS